MSASRALSVGGQLHCGVLIFPVLFSSFVFFSLRFSWLFFLQHFRLALNVLVSQKKESKEKEEPPETDVIVIDNGQAYVKAGFAGDDAPRLVVPTMVVPLPPQGVWLLSCHAVLCMHACASVFVTTATQTIDVFVAINAMWLG